MNDLRWDAGLYEPAFLGDFVWFDTNRDGEYVGHRMPIYSQGPEILMIRNGVELPDLGVSF